MSELYFDEGRAERVVRFFSRVLVHTKGIYKGRPFVPAPWQADDILRPLFGTIRFNEQLDMWVRAYTLAWLEMARKNGKSEVGAGVGLYLMSSDGEEAAEVYGAARDKDQCMPVYGVAKRMCEISPALAKLVDQKKLRLIDSKKRIVWTPTDSFYQVLPGDDLGNLGLNPHGVIFDEIVSQPSRELWDVFETAQGVRTQPLMVALTTAGSEPGSLAAEEHLQSLRVLSEPDIEPTRFVYMRNAPDDADWRDEKVWHIANPALGDFKQLQTMRDAAKAAEASLARQNAFRVFHLNQWRRQHNPWIDIEVWNASDGPIDVAELVDRDCYGGLDLASTSDFAAWVMTFPFDDHDDVVARFFLPQAAVERRGPMRPLLEQWVADGWLQITAGEVIDFDAIYDQIDRDAERFNILEIGYDRWNASQLVRDLDDAGMATRGIAQTTAGLSAATKELERRLGLRRLRTGGHPILRWMAENVMATMDSSGNIKPDRKKSEEKIDGIVALVDAIACELRVEGADFAAAVGPDGA